VPGGERCELAKEILPEPYDSAIALFGDLGFYEADLTLPRQSIEDVSTSVKDSLGSPVTVETGHAQNAFGAEWQTIHAVWIAR